MVGHAILFHGRGRDLGHALDGSVYAFHQLGILNLHVAVLNDILHRVAGSRAGLVLEYNFIPARLQIDALLREVGAIAMMLSAASLTGVPSLKFGLRTVFSSASTFCVSASMYLTT